MYRQIKLNKASKLITLDKIRKVFKESCQCDKEFPNHSCVAKISYRNYVWGISKKGIPHFCCRAGDDKLESHLKAHESNLKALIKKKLKIKGNQK